MGSARPLAQILGQAKVKAAYGLDSHFVAFVDMKSGRVNDFRAARFQLGVEGIDIVHPVISV